MQHLQSGGHLSGFFEPVEGTGLLEETVVVGFHQASQADAVLHLAGAVGLGEQGHIVSTRPDLTSQIETDAPTMRWPSVDPRPKGKRSDRPD